MDSTRTCGEHQAMGFLEQELRGYYRKRFGIDPGEVTYSIMITCARIGAAWMLGGWLSLKKVGTK